LMESTKTPQTPLPPDLEKEAGALKYLSKGTNALKKVLVGQSDNALRASGKLRDIRQHVTRSGFETPKFNELLNVGSKKVNDAGALLRPDFIPGVSQVAGGITKPVTQANAAIDKWYNPLRWYLGGSEGVNVLKSRFAQGGLFGKGGIVRGTYATNPRLAYNYNDLRAGRRLLPNFKSTGLNAWERFDTGSILGTAGRGTAEVLKKGIGLSIPAAALYSAFNPEEGDERGLGQRLGGAVGETVGTFASWPMGYLSWVPSTVAPFLTDDEAIIRASDAISPWTIGRNVGEFAGALGQTKKFDPEEYQRRKYEQQLLQASLMQQRYLNSMSMPAPQLPPSMQYRQQGSTYYPSALRRTPLYGAYRAGVDYNRYRRSAPAQAPLPPGLNSSR
jgi:hypothetical protein